MSGDSFTRACNEKDAPTFKTYYQLQAERHNALIQEVEEGCPCRRTTENGASCSLNRSGVCRIGMTTCPILFSARIACHAERDNIW